MQPYELVVTGASERFSKPLVAALTAEGIASVVYHCPGGEPTTATAEAAIAMAASNKCGAVIAIGGLALTPGGCTNSPGVRVTVRGFIR